jgi:hypothetical protein
MLVVRRAHVRPGVLEVESTIVDKCQTLSRRQTIYASGLLGFRVYFFALLRQVRVVGKLRLNRGFLCRPSKAEGLLLGRLHVDWPTTAPLATNIETRQTISRRRNYQRPLY